MSEQEEHNEIMQMLKATQDSLKPSNFAVRSLPTTFQNAKSWLCLFRQVKRLSDKEVEKV